jgi:hypothetical protein
MAVTPESALYEFEFQVMAALTAIQQVLPDMLEKKTGELLFIFKSTIRCRNMTLRT